MTGFFLRRLMYGLLVLWGVATVVFFLFIILPADPARLTLGQRADAETLQAVRKELGLDQPIWKQYLRYLADLSPLDQVPQDYQASRYIQLFQAGAEEQWVLKAPNLRRSYQSQQPVSTILADAIPNTLLLAGVALLMASVVGLALGVTAALRPGSALDQSLMSAAVLGISTPSFFSAILIAWVFGYLLHEYTHLPMFGSLKGLDPFRGEVYQWRHLVLPAFTLGIRPLAIITQLTRASTMEVLRQDFIRTAYAKGLYPYQILWRHALRNALNPVVTAISGWFASLVAGAFFVEYIFAWRGIGKVTVDALATANLPVAMGALLSLGALFVAVNILVDLVYYLLDPRIQLE